MNSLTERIKAIEEEEIRQALRESDWVKSKAAQRLGITERMIGYKIKKYEIRKEGKRSERKPDKAGGSNQEPEVIRP